MSDFTGNGRARTKEMKNLKKWILSIVLSFCYNSQLDVKVHMRTWIHWSIKYQRWNLPLPLCHFCLSLRGSA